MLVLQCEIIITGTKVIKFNYIVSCEVVTSMKNLTDTAKIVLPRNLKFKEKNISDYLHRGDRIEIKLGYGESLETVFKGFLTGVKTGTPVTLECEDAAWLLKQKTVKNLYYEKFSLSAFISEHLPELTDKTIADVNLGEMRISGEVSLARVFDYLMKNYPLRFFFRNGRFYGILPQTELINSKTIKFTYGKNIISDNLKYTLAKDVKIAIIAKVITKDNKSLKVTEPAEAEREQSEYEFRTFFYPDAVNESQLRQYAQKEIKNFKTDKMEGNFTAFGIPFVRFGDIVAINDEVHPERNNKKFVVDGVTYTFGTEGYRQKIYLENEIHQK